MHEFTAQVASRCRTQPACPMCAHRIVCPATSLAAERPDIAKEWLAERNPGLDPSTVMAKSGLRVWWKCDKRDHLPFRQRISQRALQHARCPECADDVKRTKMTAAQREQALRRVRRGKAERRRARPGRKKVTVPRRIRDSEPRLTVTQASAELGVTVQTVRNWIRAGTIAAENLGNTKPFFVIPASEVKRLKPPKQLPPAKDTKGAA
jgi:excisionase family DNA binding protein